MECYSQSPVLLSVSLPTAIGGVLFPVTCPVVSVSLTTAICGVLFPVIGPIVSVFDNSNWWCAIPSHRSHCQCLWQQQLVECYSQSPVLLSVSLITVIGGVLFPVTSPIVSVSLTTAIGGVLFPVTCPIVSVSLTTVIGGVLFPVTGPVVSVFDNSNWWSAIPSHRSCCQCVCDNSNWWSAIPSHRSCVSLVHLTPIISCLCPFRAIHLTLIYTRWPYTLIAEEAILYSVVIKHVLVLIDNKVFIVLIHSFNGCVCCLCSSPTVPNLLPNEFHSWSFLVILAMTMTMTINSNSVLLVCVASAGRYEFFEHVQKVCVPSSAQHEYFSFMVMRIEKVIFFVAQPTCCILVILTVVVVVLTVYYVIRTDNETGTDHKTVRTKMIEAAKYIFV